VRRQTTPFSADVHRDGDDLVAVVIGDLDVHTAARLRAVVEEAHALESGAPRLVLDAAGVGFVDSSGLGAIRCAA